MQDQASTLAELLHHDTAFPAKSRILEPGCGVGAQTITLARKSPDSHLISIDMSRESIAVARNRIQEKGYRNVSFQQDDIFKLPFKPGSFSHIFVCFVLEHLPQPDVALGCLKGLLKEGSTITVIEGDHGSTYFHPDNEAAYKSIKCQVELQKRAGGNANIGRELYPILKAAGFSGIKVSPRMVYVDSSKPHLVEGFTKNTFTAMVEGVRESAIKAGLITAETFDDGINALYRTTEIDGVFCYTFFKAVVTNG
jgi:SAM-dependent methyltransferase